MSRNVSITNSSGYVDSTAHDALNNVIDEMKKVPLDEADARNNKMIKAIRQLIDLAGFDLMERIVVRDRKTGRTYR